MLRIEITPFEAGMHQVELRPEAEAVDLDPGTFRDIVVDAHLQVQEKRILVVLQASATARLECDRTLKPFDKRLEGSYSVLFATPEFARMDEDAYDDVRAFDPGDTYLDLTDVVRDTLVLAIPQRCIAPGADEIDIETEYGAPVGEDYIDPRWEALRKLRAPKDEP